jgi:hypothetical protein
MSHSVRSQDFAGAHPAGTQNNLFAAITYGLIAETRATGRELATFRDPDWTILTLAQIAAASADAKTSIDNLHRCPGCFESGISRFVVGRRPDTHKYIVAGVIEIGVEAVFAHYLRRHGPIRKWYWRYVWSLPQTFSLYAHTQAAFHNSRLNLTCNSAGLNCY